MNIGSISSDDLPKQTKYNSFILCQTKNISLSQKFPFIVTTLKNQITKQSLTQEPYQQFQCNYSFDCVSYIINGKYVILGQGNWIRQLLTAKQNSLLERYQIINFQPLQLKNQLKFYFYHQKKKLFIHIQPKYLILPDCIVFQEVNHIIDTQFKIVNLTDTQKIIKSYQNDKQQFVKQTFHFQSEYAIMSDIHFWGSFVRGYKAIGSYLKMKNSNQYFHIIDEILLRNLKRLYPFSNL